MKRYLYIIVALLLFASCDKDAHRDEAGIVVRLTDTTDPIGDVTLWAFDADRMLAKQVECSSPQQVAATVLRLPEGEYTILAATNLRNAFSHNATVGTTTMNDLLISIGDASSSPAHAHYGIATATMEPNAIHQANIALSRTMAEMQFTIKNVPAEVKSAQLKVLNSAKSYYPALSALAPGMEAADYGEITPENGRLLFASKRVMPVVAMPTQAADAVKTCLQLHLEYTNGGELTFTLETPALQNGGVYAPEVTYSQLRPNVTVQITEINGWVTLPAIQGSILNPNL